MLQQLASQFIYKKTPEFCLYLAETVFNIGILQHPEHLISKEKLKELFIKDFMYLNFAIITKNKQHFTSYLKWRRRVFESRLIPTKVLRDQYVIFMDFILLHCDPQLEACLYPYLEAGLQIYDKLLELPGTYLDESYLYSELSREYIGFVMRGELEKANGSVLKQLENTIPLEDIYTKIIKNIQYEIGRLWEMNLISVSQEHASTVAAHALLMHVNAIKSASSNGKIVISACLTREMHEMGLNLVTGYLRLHGYTTRFKGANNSVSAMIAEIKDMKPDAVAISISMPMWQKYLLHLIQEIKDIQNPPKVIVGGYLFLDDPQAYQLFGADGYSKDPEDAVKLLDTLFSKEASRPAIG